MGSLDDFLKDREKEGFDPNKEYHLPRSLSKKEFKIDMNKQITEIGLYFSQEKFRHSNWDINEAAFEWIKVYSKKYRNYQIWERFYKK